MSKCNSDSFSFRLEQVGKLKNQDIVILDILDELSSCDKINARSAAKTGTGITGLFFNATNVPDDAFGCSQNKCFNSGTVQGVATATTVTLPEIKKAGAFAHYAAGIMTMYVLLPESATPLTVSIEFRDFAAGTATTTYAYTVDTSAGAGLYPIAVDFGTTPTSGTGDPMNDSGIRFAVTVSTVAVDDAIGFSSISLFESIEDLQINKTVIVSCIDSIGDSQSFDVIEGACAGSEYDENSGSMTGTMTVNKVSGNFALLNPTAFVEDTNAAGVPAIVTKTVTAETINGIEYGVVALSDIAKDECGFVYVQTPGCANGSSELVRVNSPVPVKLDGSQFQVISATGKLLVAADWVGKELNIVYRKEISAEVIAIKDEFKEYHVRAIAPFNKKDGSTEYHVYENVLLTAYSNNISRSSESTVELQFNVEADTNGIRKRIIREKEDTSY